MNDVLVAIGDHGPAAIPSPLPDDVHRSRQERIGVPNHGPDVEIVLPVLDDDVEGVAVLIEVGLDGLDGPVAVVIDDIAPVSLGQQLGIEAGVVGPRFGVGSDADFDPGRVRFGQQLPPSRSALAPTVKG